MTTQKADSPDLYSEVILQPGCTVHCALWYVHIPTRCFMHAIGRCTARLSTDQKSSGSGAELLSTLVGSACALDVALTTDTPDFTENVDVQDGEQSNEAARTCALQGTASAGP